MLPLTQSIHQILLSSIAAALVTLAACSTNATAANYYVSNSGSNSNVGTQASPFQTIQKGLSVLVPGDTLILRDGTYSGATNEITNPPSGSPGNYITIRAENEGSVILTAGLALPHTSAYLIFQGLRFHDTNGRGILGNHHKFLRNEFRGGCINGNCSGTSVGTNDYNDTADILLEDNWFHGLGGRYNLLVYNSNRVVIRRAVIRHDGGWTDTKGDPEAGINFYNSSDCSSQNIIVLDNTLSYHSWQGAIYSVYNSASPNATNNNSWYGNIALNGLASGFILDGNGQQTGHIVQDFVAWDVEYAMNMGTGSSDIRNMTINRATLGRNQLNDGTIGAAHWASWAGNATNMIIARFTQDANINLSYFNTYGNENTSTGTGRVTYNPLTNGLLYLTRIENGTALKTAGSAGGQIGAQIVYAMGASGTLKGENGWNTLTGSMLWPFPNETRIKKEMCTDANITRGFCSSSSLTNYIHSYLGNPNPYSSGTPTIAAPINLRTQ